MPGVRPKGMSAFVLIWIGQVVSLMGSAMTQFGLGIWAWEKTGQATPLAMVGFFGVAPMILITPFAGVLVDRWNRKLVMALSDIATAFSSVFILILLLLGKMEIWHLYVASTFAGIFGAFQWPAYSAAISLMIPKEQYGRASGMISMAETGSGILAPILAAVLIVKIGLTGILVIDLLTLIFALVMLMLVDVPSVASGEQSMEGRGGFFKELAYGFHYLFSRASLLGLQLVFFFGNFFSSIAFSLLTPMILSRTGGDATLLGSTQSAGAIGGLIGSLILTAWGGPKKKVVGVLGGWIASGILGLFLYGITGSYYVWLVASFLMMMIIPILNGSNQAIWQAKVAPEVQGRVFSVRRLVAQITSPLAMLIAGPLADKVMEPAMQNPESSLARLVGPVTGTGEGVGMGLIVAVCGLLMAVVGIVPFFIPTIRNVETILPDHQSGV
jgi:DHA3 family macrolide efflux protein-like MFS transporter